MTTHREPRATSQRPNTVRSRQSSAADSQSTAEPTPPAPSSTHHPIPTKGDDGLAFHANWPGC